MAMLAPGTGVEKTRAELCLRRFEGLKGPRLAHETGWQEIAQYCLPRRSFQLTNFVEGDLISRRLLDSTGLINNDRLAAMMFGFLVSQAMPFVRPSVDRSLVAAGRQVDMDLDGRDWLDGVEWSMFDHFMSVKSGFKTAGFETLSEWVGFGNGVMWTGSRPGFGAFYQSRPLQSCWFAENADDEVDTLYYAFTLPAYRVLQKWPGAKDLKNVQDACRRTEHAPVKLLLAVEPREHGRAGAIARAKPFGSYLVAIEDKVTLEESGYESFPYSVPRFYKRPGDAYGYGPGHIALPNLRTLNAVMESVLRGAELRTDPPIMVPMRLFSRPIQRKRGSVNYYNAAQLGLQTADQAVRPINVAGDVGLGLEIIRELRQSVEYAYFTDWMRPRESGVETATAVNDRRDMRLRGLGPISGRAESDFMGPSADRTFVINEAEGQFGDAPSSLRGLDVTWGYTGPLAIAQLQAQRDGVSMAASYAGELAKYDKIAAQTFDAEEGFRVLGDSVGLPPAVLRTRQAMAEIRKREEAAALRAMQTQDDQGQAQALRDGGQGVQSLANALGGQGGQPAPAEAA